MTGLDFFVIRWCCLAGGWDVGPVSDYQRLCMMHLPIANGLESRSRCIQGHFAMVAIWLWHIVVWAYMTCSLLVVVVVWCEVYVMFTV